jgi:hypothetical protein
MEASTTRSPLENLLENTWVLIALLALVVIGGIVWHRNKQTTPDEMFARGLALMDKPRGAAWDSAKVEIFEPLLKIDEEEWGPRVQPHLDRIAAYEAERELRGTEYRRAPKERTEVERLLLLGLDQRDAGRLAAAERTFEAIDVLLGEAPEQKRWRQANRQFLFDVRAQRKAADAAGESYALLRASLERAAQLQQDGDLPGAQQIWRSAVELYHDDPGAAELLNDALAGLQLRIPDAPEAATSPDSAK